jgi:hypothetical protein
MRLPSARKQLLALLVPVVGVSLTFTGNSVAARRTSNSQSSRTRVSRTLRANVGHEWDVLHEEPDKRWEHYDPKQSLRANLPLGLRPVVAEAPPVAPPPVLSVEFLPRDKAEPLHTQKPATARGRSPPPVS